MQLRAVLEELCSWEAMSENGIPSRAVPTQQRHQPPASHLVVENLGGPRPTSTDR